jgi:hypothetical protein
VSVVVPEPPICTLAQGCPATHMGLDVSRMKALFGATAGVYWMGEACMGASGSISGWVPSRCVLYRTGRVLPLLYLHTYRTSRLR